MIAAVPVFAEFPILLKSLRIVLVERGLKLTVAKKDEVVARWPVHVARVAQEGARIAVLRRNDRGEWRGVIMVGTGKGYDLVAQEVRFRDLVHVSLWLGMHAPNSSPVGRDATDSKSVPTGHAAGGFQ